MIKHKKCIVWDLDNTLWQGTIAEGDKPVVDTDIVDIIKYLDQRGVLNSIASRNDTALAIQHLKELDLQQYFVYPQCHWEEKYKSILTISESLNIGIDSLCFVDDQVFEREHVSFMLEQVECFSPEQIKEVYTSELFPSTVSQESKSRRKLYQTEQQRKLAEENFEGENRLFLKSLELVLSISQLTDNDFDRAEELTLRTNQLNTTGYTYDKEQLSALSCDDKYLVLKAQLTDKYGDYGTIGLCVLEITHEVMQIKLFLLSCRVMSRGISGAFLQCILDHANAKNLYLCAEYVPNGRNKQMLFTYKMSGFVVLEHKEIQPTKTKTILQHKKLKITLATDHVTVNMMLDKELGYV